MSASDELGEHQHPGHAWATVTCRKCRRTYTCTPEDDYYDDGHGAGAGEGVCTECMLDAAGIKGPALDVDDLLLEELREASAEILYSEAERADEGLMLDGLDERAAVSMTNESLHPAYTIAGRCQHAADIVAAEKLAAELAAALEAEGAAPVSVSYVAQDGALYVDGQRWA